MAPRTERLATWAEVSAHLTATYPNARVREDGRVAVDVPLSQRSSQTVIIATHDLHGAAWLDVRAVIGSARYVSPVHALDDNMRASVGALGVEEGQLVLRQLLALEGVRICDLDETIGVLALRCHQARKAAG